MNIWDHNYLFEHPNTTDQQGCPYILPGEQFTQMDDFFITLKEFIIICRQTNYIPQIDAHIQIYQQYEQILFKEQQYPNGVSLHKQYFIIRQLSNQQMEVRLLPFKNCGCLRQLSQKQIWHKLKKLCKVLFQFQHSNPEIQKLFDKLTQSIRQQEQSQVICPTINFYDFKSTICQRIVIYNTDLDLYDKTGLSMIFRLLSLREDLQQGQIIEIIDKYKQIRDKFKLWYSQYLSDVIYIIRQQLNFKNQDYYLSIDYQFQYKFQQETIAITQSMLRSQRSQQEIDLIIKKSIKDYTKRYIVLFFENLLDKLSKQMDK